MTLEISPVQNKNVQTSSVNNSDSITGQSNTVFGTEEKFQNKELINKVVIYFNMTLEDWNALSPENQMSYLKRYESALQNNNSVKEKSQTENQTASRLR